MSIQAEPKFLASLEIGQPGFTGKDGEKAGISTYGHNSPLRLFAWIIGNTVDIRLGSKMVTLDKKSLENFVNRHPEIKNLKGDTVVQKFQAYLNSNHDAQHIAAMDLHAPKDAELDSFRVEQSDVFTGPTRVFEDMIKALKSLPEDISKGLVGFSREITKGKEKLHADVKSGKISQNIQQFIKDAGNSAPVKQLEKDLDTIKKDVEQFARQIKNSPQMKSMQESIHNFENRAREFLGKPPRAASVEKEISVTKWEVVKAPPKAAHGERKAMIGIARRATHPQKQPEAEPTKPKAAREAPASLESTVGGTIGTQLKKLQIEEQDTFERMLYLGDVAGEEGSVVEIFYAITEKKDPRAARLLLDKLHNGTGWSYTKLSLKEYNDKIQGLRILLEYKIEESDQAPYILKNLKERFTALADLGKKGLQ